MNIAVIVALLSVVLAAVLYRGRPRKIPQAEPLAPKPTPHDPTPAEVHPQEDLRRTTATQEEVTQSGVLTNHGEEKPHTENQVSPAEEQQQIEGPVNDESSTETATATPDRNQPVSEGGEPDANKATNENEQITDQETRNISPKDRGGRHRGEFQTRKAKQTDESRQRTPKAEVICWKKDREWILAVEIPAQMSNLVRVISQSGIPLDKDESQDGCWRLAQLTGEITIAASVHISDFSSQIVLDNTDHLLFKLSGEGLDQGRRVKSASIGSYLVVAPADWTRDEERGGIAPAVPEPICMENYRGHFFDLAGDPTVSIALQDATGRVHVIGFVEPPFRLVGQELPDASDGLGPIFRGSPPRVGLTHGSWKYVGIIVLGAEGSGRGRWRISFKPDTATQEQALRVEKDGWYFVRFYDLQDDLIDSLDFRFTVNLQDIIVRKGIPLPSLAGHEAATIELCHDTGFCIEQFPTNERNVEIKHTEEKTVLTIPPTQSCDLTHWMVGTDGGSRMKLALLVERVWWAAGDMDRPPLQWGDTSIALSPEHFTATSNRAIWVRLPKRRWVTGVFVGFQRANSRQYPVRVTGTALAIPLRDFADAGELADRQNVHTLKFWLSVGGTYHEAAVATLAADVVEGPVVLARISACHLATVLTKLKRVARGPLRQLLKDVRRKYRRLRRASARLNDDFVIEALCAIDICVNLADATNAMTPKSLNRWKSKALRAVRQFPEPKRRILSTYRQLEMKDKRRS